ncbi:hypothetical protein ACF0H5_010056 [Mactra antiquata]
MVKYCLLLVLLDRNSTMDTNYLYRVLRPDENLAVGINARAPSSARTVEEHISKGSYYPSKFISTSKSLEAAKLFASHTKNKPVRIAKIDVTKLQNTHQIIDLTDPDVVDQYISVGNDFARNCVKKFEEVLIVGHIPPQCLQLATVVE